MKMKHIYSMTDKLSDHFRYYEMVESETAERKGILNIPNRTEIDNFKGLCRNVLEPIRSYVRKTWKKTGYIKNKSGFRCRKLNKDIGGSSRSQHCKGEADDFQVPGVGLYKVWKWIVLESGLPFDQCIMEYPTVDLFIPWIHVSHKVNGNNKGIITVAVKEFKNRWSKKKVTKYYHFTKDEIERGLHFNIIE